MAKEVAMRSWGAKLLFVVLAVCAFVWPLVFINIALAKPIHPSDRLIVSSRAEFWLLTMTFGVAYTYTSLSTVQALVYALGLFVLGYVGIRVSGISLGALGLSRQKLLQAVVWMCIAWASIALFLRFIGIPFGKLFVLFTKPSVWVYWVLVWCFISVSEEFFFRGYVFSMIERMTEGKRWASGAPVVVSTLLYILFLQGQVYLPRQALPDASSITTVALLFHTGLAVLVGWVFATSRNLVWTAWLKAAIVAPLFPVSRGLIIMVLLTYAWQRIRIIKYEQLYKAVEARLELLKLVWKWRRSQEQESQ
ncbi:MAG: CPBP family intramembrane metalloprotease [Ardenticatenia bacterium]|nr:MAG: CPBP family intramembrane metalloprotease [Ardenticatenia bacterium]